MPAPQWKIQDEHTLAEYLPESDFKGLLEQRIAVPPDHLAILIRDGQIVDAYDGAMIATGGIWQRMKELIGGKHALRMLVADMKPFPITMDVSGWSKDHVELKGEITIEFQLDPSEDKRINVMGLITNNVSLARDDVYERIRPHVQERSFMAELVQHDAAELRANSGLQDRIQADVMKETKRIAGDLGLIVRAVSITWAMNADEEQALVQKTVARVDAQVEFHHKRKLRDLERTKETINFKMETKLDIATCKAMSETEFKKLVFDNQVMLADARSSAERRQEIEGIAHDIDTARQRRQSRHDEALANATNDLERSRLELDGRRLQMEFTTEERRLELVLKEEERRSEIALKEEDAESGLRLSDKGWQGQHGKLKDLQELELAKEKARRELDKDDFLTKHSAELQSKQADSQSELEKLRLQAGMSADQLLAVQAGASPEVAKVFAEQAKQAQGAEKEALLREMLEKAERAKEQSESRNQANVDKAMDRVADVGMAAATGRPPAPGSGGGARAVAAAEDVECPKCRHKVPANDRFCKTCGEQMRSA